MYHKEIDWMQQVEAGMSVFDADGNNIGNVESFQYGTEGITETVPHEQNKSLIEEIAATFSPEQFPKELRARMLQEGFIRIDKGILQGYGYVSHSNIMNVNDDGVHLSVTRDQILVPR